MIHDCIGFASQPSPTGLQNSIHIYDNQLNRYIVLLLLTRVVIGLIVWRQLITQPINYESKSSLTRLLAFFPSLQCFRFLLSSFHRFFLAIGRSYFHFIQHCDTKSTWYLSYTTICADSVCSRFLQARAVCCLSTEIFEIVSYHRDFYSTPLNNGIWHSICITWKRSTHICTAYIDGKTNKRRTFTGCRGDTEFEFGQPLVLGQLVKSKGRFQEGNSFTGNINGVNMWDYAMEENEVYNLATNCLSRVGNVVSWPLFRNVLEGNVVLTEGSICSGPGK